MSQSKNDSSFAYSSGTTSAVGGKIGNAYRGQSVNLEPRADQAAGGSHGGKPEMEINRPQEALGKAVRRAEVICHLSDKRPAAEAEIRGLQTKKQIFKSREPYDFSKGSASSKTTSVSSLWRSGWRLNAVFNSYMVKYERFGSEEPKNIREVTSSQGNDIT